MTPGQWREIAAELDNLWPSRDGFDQHREAAYFRYLERYPVDAVRAAIDALMCSGRQFFPFPSASDLVAECEKFGTDSVEIVPWAEAWDLMRRAGGRYGVARRDEGVSWLHDHDPVVAAFAELEWRALCTEQVGDPDRGGMIVAQFERRYREFGERVRERGLVQLAARRTAGQLRQVEVPQLEQQAHDTPASGGAA